VPLLFSLDFEPQLQLSCAPSAVMKKRLPGASLVNPGTKRLEDLSLHPLLLRGLQDLVLLMYSLVIFSISCDVINLSLRTRWYIPGFPCVLTSDLFRARQATGVAFDDED